MISVAKVELTQVGQSKSFEVEVKGRLTPAFAIQTREGLKAYLNICPHARVQLDYDDNDFYHPDYDRIVCKTHGATFELESGLCDAGPCAKQFLTQLKIEDSGEFYKLYYAQ